MFAFFQAQMDYIYFFYGLTFIFLSVVCFLTKRQYKFGPNWFLLGMFGAAAGFYEWVELVKIIFGYIGWWFHTVRLLSLAISFIFLFEFARNYFNSNIKIKIGNWVYGLIALIILLGWRFFGVIGVEIFVRFILGVGGAFGAGLVFWRFNFIAKEHSNSFCLGAIAFWLYALSQLVNSAGQILGISYTDQAIFFSSVGVPIQLVRVILVNIILICVWSHFQSSFYKELTAQQIVKKTKLGRYLAIILVVFFIVSWFFCNVLGSLAYKEIYANSNKLTRTLTSDLERVLTAEIDLSKILSDSPSVINLLKNPNVKNIQTANVVLDRYKASNNVDIAYILNSEGTTLATSNRNASDSLLGNNYVFRPYFFKAIKGEPTILFAIGVTTKKSGFYTSNPVRDDQGNIIGVSVIKVNLDTVEKDFKEYGPMFLVSPEGVVFLSGDSNYYLKSFQEISIETKRELYKSRQFNKGSFESVFDTRPKNNDLIKLNGQPFLLKIVPVDGEGWELFIFSSTNLITYYRFFGIVLFTVFYFLAISFFIVIQYTKRNAVLSYFTSVILYSNDAVVGVDLSGKIVSCNKSLEKIYGYNKNEILGKNIDLLSSSDERKEIWLIFGRVIAGKFAEHIDVKYIKRNDQVINVSLAFSTIKNDEGDMVGVSIIVRDITREKDVENKLKNQMVELEKFKLTTDSSSDFIIITDKDANVLYANKAAETISGFTRKEMDSDYVGNLWGGHMEKEFYEKMWKTIKNDKKVFIGEIKNRRKNGEEYYVNARVYPLLDSFGEVRFFVGMETDITKSKELERAKSEFVSVASHQLRTPLTGIKWFSELLLNGKAGILNSEQKDYIKQVFISNDRMIKLVDDLLDVSHIDDSGKFRILLAKDNFSSIIKEVVDQQKNLAKEKNIKIKLGAGCLKKTLLKIDRVKIEQAMQNILNNSIKYSPNGGTISVDCQEENSNFVCSFKDKGIGIPAHQQHRVFEKFFRADNVITIGSGTGLGLYIAKFIMEGHYGKIWFESKENKGTTFYISLPIR